MTDSAVRPEDGAHVAALLLPLDTLNLVVPQAAVAEVISRPRLETVSDGPDWVTGMFHWRSEQLPLVSLERLMGRAPREPGSGARVVVLYGLSGQAGVDYYGVEVQGIPRPLLLRREMVDDVRDGATPVGRAVVVGGQPGIVPDLVGLERRLNDWLIRA